MSEERWKTRPGPGLAVALYQQGEAPDAGALEFGEAQSGESGRFPEIPPWLLEEWPPSRRGQ